MKKIYLSIATMIIFVGLLAGCGNSSSPGNSVQRLDLSSYSLQKPQKPLNLLFIHHSCGATLFADEGEKSGAYCLWNKHPTGGGLRNLLKKNNYNVHEATYGSKLGQDTDINHWHAKFRDKMDLALKVKLQDELLEKNRVNQIIVFKSCYPNNFIVGDGAPPGDPDAKERTLWNCKAAYNSLLPIFKDRPNTLFVAVTAPPILKLEIKNFKEKLLNPFEKGPKKIGVRARTFNNWLADKKSGWLAEYTMKNVVVFDFYNILTDYGKSNWAEYPSAGGKNSHPSSQGNSMAAEKFINFINRAIRYSGLEKNEQ